MISSISVAIALVAVVVAVWQVRTHRRGAERTNSLPVISAAFNEFRSEEFQDHLRNVWFRRPDNVPEGGFQDLPDDWRTSAYTVAYFFEYMGVLVAYELVPARFVIDFVANTMARSWVSLASFIEAERRFRAKHSDAEMSAGFVSHFEHLVALSVDPKVGPVDAISHKRLGLKKASPGIFSGASYPTDGGAWKPPSHIVNPYDEPDD